MKQTEHQIQSAKKYAKRMGRVVCNCKLCNAEFTVKHSHWLKGEGKYCSKACSVKGIGKEVGLMKKSKRKITNCIVCKKELDIKPRQVLPSGNCCSRKCYSINCSIKFIGSSNPNFKGNPKNNRPSLLRIHIKKEINKLWVRQNGECVYCNKSLYGDYHLDHIIPYSKGGTNFIGNIQILCSQCNLRKNAMLPIQFKSKIKNKSTEDDLQKALMSWWKLQCGFYRLPEFALFHIPNGGYRHIKTAVNFKKLGVRRGVPDLLLATPNKHHAGLFIEMKAGTNQPSKEQREFMGHALTVGYQVALCYQWEDASKVIHEYLEQR